MDGHANLMLQFFFNWIFLVPQNTYPPNLVLIQDHNLWNPRKKHHNSRGPQILEPFFVGSWYLKFSKLPTFRTNPRHPGAPVEKVFEPPKICPKHQTSGGMTGCLGKFLLLHNISCREICHPNMNHKKNGVADTFHKSSWLFKNGIMISSLNQYH